MPYILSKQLPSKAHSYLVFMAPWLNPWDFSPWIGRQFRLGWTLWAMFENITPWRSTYIYLYHTPVFDKLVFFSSPTREHFVEPLAPITYTSLQSCHIQQVHDLLERSFWSGINGTNTLSYWQNLTWNIQSVTPWTICRNGAPWLQRTND